MGQIDITAKALFKDNEIFADAFNYFYFDGQEVVKANDLHELDTNEIGITNKELEELIQIQRDVLKQWSCIKQDEDITYVILGIENQTHVDYAMPLRVMAYDAYRYLVELRDIGKYIRENYATIKPTKDEFISGFRKEDKLKDIVTLVVYFGDKKWDAYKKLSEIKKKRKLAFSNTTKEYEIDVLEIGRLLKKESEKFNTELRELSLCLSCGDDFKAIKEIITGDNGFLNISGLTAKLINELSGEKLKLPESEKERVNMRKAIEGIELDAMNRGIEEGLEKGETIGFTKGALSTLISLVKDGLLNINQAALRADLSEEQFKIEMTKAGY